MAKILLSRPEFMKLIESNDVSIELDGVKVIKRRRSKRGEATGNGRRKRGKRHATKASRPRKNKGQGFAVSVGSEEE